MALNHKIAGAVALALTLGLAASLLALCPPECRAGDGTPLKTLSFVYIHPGENLKTKALVAVYTEAARRLGYGFEFVDVPARRASKMVNSGEVDGDLNRNIHYDALFDSVVRIPEHNFCQSSVVLSTDKGIAVDGWGGLSRGNLHVGYVCGIVFHAKNIKKYVHEDMVTPVSSTSKGFRMLLEKRFDVFVVDSETALLFMNSPEYKSMIAGYDDARRVYNVGTVENIHTYAWVHKSHADLVEPFARVLRQLKREGFFADSFARVGLRWSDDCPSP